MSILHTCPACKTRQIPDEKYLCNQDAAATPDALIVAYGIAWDANDALGMTVALASILKLLGK